MPLKAICRGKDIVCKLTGCIAVKVHRDQQFKLLKSLSHAAFAANRQKGIAAYNKERADRLFFSIDEVGDEVTRK